jgi:lysylphosphatidylglycerol synthetase-like protein (DUF2156 family)
MAAHGTLIAIVDGILILVLLEAAALLVYRRLTGAGIEPTGLISNLLAGVFLLLALRGALSNLSLAWIGACLAAALAAHISDMTHRWRS